MPEIAGRPRNATAKIRQPRPPVRLTGIGGRASRTGPGPLKHDLATAFDSLRAAEGETEEHGTRTAADAHHHRSGPGAASDSKSRCCSTNDANAKPNMIETASVTNLAAGQQRRRAKKEQATAGERGVARNGRMRASSFFLSAHSPVRLCIWVQTWRCDSHGYLILYTHPVLCGCLQYSVHGGRARPRRRDFRRLGRPLAASEMRFSGI